MATTSPYTQLLESDILEAINHLNEIKLRKANTNYHTHTFRCKHASGTASDYAKIAVEKKFTILGISDHSALPDNRWQNIRMPIEDLQNYSDEIDEASATYPQIKILKGMECEYAPEYTQFYIDELLGKYRFDYLIGGAHFFPVQNEWMGCYSADNTKANLFAYTDYIIDSIESKLFAFIAHPDLFGNFYLKWDKETISCSRAILEAAAGAQVPLEINGYGYRKEMILTNDGFRKRYPLDNFWELAENYEISVIINSDAHKPEDIDKFGDAFDLVEKHALKVITEF